MKLSKDINIVVVDDDYDAISLIKSLLNSIGFRNIKTFSNSLELYSYLEDMPEVDILLVDWNMPESSGLEVLKILRHTDKYPLYSDTPFVMVTVDNERENILEAISQGVSSYLLKPYSRDQVVSHIKKAFSKADF